MDMPSLRPGESFEGKTAGGVVYKIRRATVQEREALAARLTGSSALPPKPTPCIHLGPQLPDQTFPPPDGLGDKIANLFDAVGLTKQRYAELRGLAPDECGCSARQKIANWIGEKIGLEPGKGPELQKILQIMDVPAGPVFGCDVYGQAIKHLAYNGEPREAVEAAGYGLCHNCPHYQPPTERPQP